MDTLLVLVPKTTNRLRYAFDLVMHRLLGLEYRFTTDIGSFSQFPGWRMVYGEKAVEGVAFFKARHLLFEREIVSQEINPFDFEGVKAIFPVYDRNSLLPFDLFAASFFLVSRYEEYLPFSPDRYGRFEATSSCLHTMGMLQKPLVNIWSRHLARVLQAAIPRLSCCFPAYSFQPTYDIDAAWAYLHKGPFRGIGATLRDLLKRDFNEIKARNSVILKKQPDPFDTFELQLELQKRYRLRPVYFILFAEYGLNDKNTPVRNPHFRQLIKHLADYAPVGIHPSFGSFLNKPKLRSEISTLAAVLNREVTKSRQHFLRLSLPATYHHLIDLDITDDYTMGYASQPGFRAGIATSFPFYDLDHDLPTNLHIHPITLMDGTLRDYLALEKEKAIQMAFQLCQEVKEVGGTFTTLWHNESLSNQKRWAGWLDIYEEIIRFATAPTSS
ncbi:hypothetical protein MASR2M12_07900 [Bacteroidales bacterium]